MRADAENSMRYINGTRLDDRIVRIDWDAGFIEGRQYGRGKTGGQVIYFVKMTFEVFLKFTNKRSRLSLFTVMYFIIPMN